MTEGEEEGGKSGSWREGWRGRTLEVLGKVVEKGKR